MPNPGSLVRLQSGFFGLVTNVTPNGRGDRVLVFMPTGAYEQVVSFDLIAEIIHEPELRPVYDLTAKPRPPAFTAKPESRSHDSEATQ